MFCVFIGIGCVIAICVVLLSLRVVIVIAAKCMALFAPDVLYARPQRNDLPGRVLAVFAGLHTVVVLLPLIILLILLIILLILLLI